MFRKRKTAAPYFRLPSPTNPVSGQSNYLYPPLKQYTRFTLLEPLTTSTEYAEAEITYPDQWGPNPIFHPEDVHIYVHNQLSADGTTYMFSGNTGDVGIALHDYTQHWRVIAMMAQTFYIGKVSGGDIAAEGTGTVTQYNQLWQITDPAVTFSVLNPHDVEIPNGWKVRWTKYPGWTDWIVEPWQWTECPPEG